MDYEKERIDTCIEIAMRACSEGRYAYHPTGMYIDHMYHVRWMHNDEIVEGRIPRRHWKVETKLAG